LFVLLLLAIVLSVLRFMDFDYPFGAFKLFFYQKRCNSYEFVYSGTREMLLPNKGERMGMFDCSCLEFTQGLPCSFHVKELKRGSRYWWPIGR
jgi:hypothetical protein